MGPLTVTEVCDPPLFATTEPLDHFLDHACNGFVTAIKHTRICIALQYLALSLSDSICFLGRMQPIESNDIVRRIAQVIESIPCTLGKDYHGHNILLEFLESGGQVVGDVVEVW